MQANQVAVLFVLLAAVCPNANATTAKSQDGVRNVLRRDLEPIDPAEKYHLQYEIDLERKRATFLVVVETTGYVGFGFSPTGGMAGADIVIGGVFDDGRLYFSDRHALANAAPIVDVSQDYELTLARENETHTTLQFYRALDTCDPQGQDVAITADTIKLIWSYGSTDEIAYHGGASRSALAVNLLDPPVEPPPFDEPGLDKWELLVNATMPAQPTTYWCSMYKTPDNYTTKRHAIAFNTRLDTAEGLRHSHHIDLYRCKAPTGVDPDEVFGPLVGLEGAECYAPPFAYPADLCTNLIYNWAVGGGAMSLPDDIGYPINNADEDGRSKSEYMLIIIHYDNPESAEGVRVESTVEIYNTPNLREIEAGIVVVSHAISFSHVVPPRTESYTTVGHCSSRCTRDTIPATGVQVFNILLHSHKTGRRLRLRHFRDRTELPWLISDDNYDFDFQQAHPLREHVQLLPGDHLTTECVQNTLDREGVTISGLGTTEEMCQSIIWYYPAGEFKFCESAYKEAKIIEQFGIEEIEWDNITKPPMVKAPESMANKSYTEVLDTMVDWSPDRVAALQEETRYSPSGHYQASCGSWDVEPASRDDNHPRPRAESGYDVGYPELDYVYEPENPCEV